jgi:hypothetical protein
MSDMAHEKVQLIQYQGIVFPYYSPFEGLSDIKLWHVMREDAHRHVLHSKFSKPTALFNQLCDGALVTFKACPRGRVLEIESVQAPQFGRVMGYRFKDKAFKVRPQNGGAPVFLLPAQNEYASQRLSNDPRVDERLALGARVSYHLDEQGNGHHARIHSLPLPTAMWRFAVGFVRAPKQAFALTALPYLFALQDIQMARQQRRADKAAAKAQKLPQKPKAE